MTKLPIRMVAVGLGALSLSGCLIIPPEAMSDHGPGSPITASPTVAPASANNTVRRVAPPPAAAPAIAMANPNLPVQYIAIPADQLYYDATGRPMAKADAIPPGFTPVVLPPHMTQAASPTLVQAPMAMPSGPAPATAPANGNSMDNVDVVAISHTTEPPLASIDSRTLPRQLPELTAPTQPLPEIVASKNEPLPAIVNNRGMSRPAAPRGDATPPGGQLLVFQQPSAYNPTNTHRASAAGDNPSNLLIPPVAPEELKLVASPKSALCSGPLTAALKAYQDGQLDEGDRHLAQIDSCNRELLRKMLPLAARLGDNSVASANPAELAELIDQLQVMASTLSARAALRIDKLSYCRTPAKPVRMGAYQPLSDDHTYRPGETIELYMEVRNFSCQAKEKEYLTHMSTVIEIRDERNEVVSRFDFERDRPVAGQAPKQDYFHICRFPVQGLATGQYTLTATVTDVPTGKSANKSLPLRVESTRRVARGSAE